MHTLQSLIAAFSVNRCTAAQGLDDLMTTLRSLEGLLQPDEFKRLIASVVCDYRNAAVYMTDVELAEHAQSRAAELKIQLTSRQYPDDDLYHV
jgi:hypothetical protein